MKIIERKFTFEIFVKLLRATNAMLRSMELSTERSLRARCGSRPLDHQVSTRCFQNVSDPDQVVQSVGEGEHPSAALSSFVPRLAHEPDGLQPAEHLLDNLAFPLADRITRMSCRARLRRGARIQNVQFRC